MQDWSDELFGALKDAGGTAYSNYAVGYNNVRVEAGTQNGIAVGNTPGWSASLGTRLPALSQAKKTLPLLRSGAAQAWTYWSFQTADVIHSSAH